VKNMSGVWWDKEPNKRVAKMRTILLCYRWRPRIWKEFRNPYLRCDRIGHKNVRKIRKIRTRDMKDYRQVVLICDCCGTITEISRTFLADYCPSPRCLSPEPHCLSGSMWKEIQDKGYTVLYEE